MSGYAHKRIAIVGATGLVGETMIQVLEESGIEPQALRLLASEQSAGRAVTFRGTAYTVEAISEAIFEAVDFALFALDGDLARHWIPIARSKGVVVIDNSSAYRMTPGVPLIVPEVNGEAVRAHEGLVANPNCSTIQSVVALVPLVPYGLKRVTYATYQAVSGSGRAGLRDLQEGRSDFYPKPISGNVLPHIDVFEPDGYTKEEHKMMFETQKILGLPELAVTATTVRVPVAYGHSVAIGVETERPVTVEALRQAYAAMPGVVLMDAPEQALYPTPLDAAGQDAVLIGRIRRDISIPGGCGIQLWCVADNVRKGAASNAVQILERLLQDV